MPWQAPLWQHWRARISAGRLPHALLIAGPAGIGKHRLVRALVAALLCRQTRADGSGCGRCPGCRQLLAGVHPSLQWLRRDPERRDIGIDAVRDLCQALTMTSHDNGVKVAVIDPVDALNINGFNALLKNLEEPPTASHLLLLSRRPMVLPATVRSRCQLLRCTPPTPEQARDWLAEQLPQAGLGELEAILAGSLGAPLAALQHWQPQLRERHARWHRVLERVMAGELPPLQAAGQIEVLREGRDIMLEFFTWCYQHALAGAREALADAASARLRRWLQMGEAAVAAMRGVEANASPQLLLEAAFERMRQTPRTAVD
ncbi:MAG: hypothetical protein KGJ55_10560 [Gammaproteobacteria bacterium]|nr:hypothetical protein [Gammaproteobacteria bacterium]